MSTCGKVSNIISHYQTKPTSLAIMSSLFVRTWLKEPGTYPVIFLSFTGICSGVLAISRYAFKSPDVVLGKDKRDPVRAKNNPKYKQTALAFHNHRMRSAGKGSEITSNTNKLVWGHLDDMQRNRQRKKEAEEAKRLKESIAFGHYMLYHF